MFDGKGRSSIVQSSSNCYCRHTHSASLRESVYKFTLLDAPISEFTGWIDNTWIMIPKVRGMCYLLDTLRYFCSRNLLGVEKSLLFMSRNCFSSYHLSVFQFSFWVIPIISVQCRHIGWALRAKFSFLICHTRKLLCHAFRVLCYIERLLLLGH